jgi:alkylhydroperoxidase/carboxymuconolactone decarboxylase family protein YurZ
VARHDGLCDPLVIIILSFDAKFDPRRTDLGDDSGGPFGGGVRSHARRALAENMTPDEVRHVGLLALTTIGFPHTVAGLAWIDEVIASKG